jgi:hypothetical protein
MANLLHHDVEIILDNILTTATLLSNNQLTEAALAGVAGLLD